MGGFKHGQIWDQTKRDQHLLPEGSVAWQEGAMWFEEMVADSPKNLVRVCDQSLAFFGQGRFGEFED